jgi:hypothetical protein
MGLYALSIGFCINSLLVETRDKSTPYAPVLYWYGAWSAPLEEGRHHASRDSKIEVLRVWNEHPVFRYFEVA